MCVCESVKCLICPQFSAMPRTRHRSSWCVCVKILIKCLFCPQLSAKWVRLHLPRTRHRSWYVRVCVGVRVCVCARACNCVRVKRE